LETCATRSAFVHAQRRVQRGSPAASRPVGFHLPCTRARGSSVSPIFVGSQGKPPPPPCP
jgi:hypothetical protein